MVIFRFKRKLESTPIVHTSAKTLFVIL